MNENLNPITETIEFQPTVGPDGSFIDTINEATPEVLAATQNLITDNVLIVGDSIPLNIKETFEGADTAAPILDMNTLTDEQRDQLKEFQKRMELYNSSRSGHKVGDTHKMNDGTSYLVTNSGAYKRLTPHVSRKAAHRKEVASRRAGKS